jgi:hypothetical protein
MMQDRKGSDSGYPVPGTLAPFPKFLTKQLSSPGPSIIGMAVLCSGFRYAGIRQGPEF